MLEVLGHFVRVREVQLGLCVCQVGEYGSGITCVRARCDGYEQRTSASAHSGIACVRVKSDVAAPAGSVCGLVALRARTRINLFQGQQRFCLAVALRAHTTPSRAFAQILASSSIAPPETYALSTSVRFGRAPPYQDQSRQLAQTFVKNVDRSVYIAVMGRAALRAHPLADFQILCSRPFDTASGA